MSLSGQNSFSSISSSDSDFEDDFYPFRDSPRTYKDEPYYYDGISDDEINYCLNNEFENVINV